MSSRDIMIEMIALISVLCSPVILLLFGLWIRQTKRKSEQLGTVATIKLAALNSGKMILAVVFGLLSFLMVGEWSLVSEVLKDDENDESI
ncbi:hypothetical protein EII17_10430 [Clostridiales bacterium COT073_COT-073]|nr:hypothetical protein EII17_10430 [Clostridiales bacterium COT073_COT-073]